jgi:hypothetical protein
MKCYNCENKNYPPEKGFPTNMSVINCKVPDYFDCYSSHIFKTKQEPDINSGKTILNSSAIAINKYDPNYIIKKNAYDVTYYQEDPRLHNVVGGTKLQLDKPPFKCNIKLDNLTTETSLNNYGQRYKSYSDVNAGQIVYYTDDSIKDAFFEPLFSKKATAVGTLYQDPMSAMKPQWERFPDEKYNPILGSSDDVAGTFQSSFLKDTQYFREDLLARQMRKRNEQRFETRWM